MRYYATLESKKVLLDTPSVHAVMRNVLRVSLKSFYFTNQLYCSSGKLLPQNEVGLGLMLSLSYAMFLSRRPMSSNAFYCGIIRRQCGTRCCGPRGWRRGAYEAAISFQTSALVGG